MPAQLGETPSPNLHRGRDRREPHPSDSRDDSPAPGWRHSPDRRVRRKRHPCAGRSDRRTSKTQLIAVRHPTPATRRSSRYDARADPLMAKMGHRLCHKLCHRLCQAVPAMTPKPGLGSYGNLSAGKRVLVEGAPAFWFCSLEFYNNPTITAHREPERGSFARLGTWPRQERDHGTAAHPPPQRDGACPTGLLRLITRSAVVAIRCRASGTRRERER